MSKQEKLTSLVNARYKALESFFTATRAVQQAERDMATIDTAIDALNGMVDAPAAAPETQAT